MNWQTVPHGSAAYPPIEFSTLELLPGFGQHIGAEAGGDELAGLDDRHQVRRIGHARVLLRGERVVPLRGVEVDAVQTLSDLLARAAFARDGVDHEAGGDHAVPGE